MSSNAGSSNDDLPKRVKIDSDEDKDKGKDKDSAPTLTRLSHEEWKATYATWLRIFGPNSDSALRKQHMDMAKARDKDKTSRQLFKEWKAKHETFLYIFRHNSDQPQPVDEDFATWRTRTQTKDKDEEEWLAWQGLSEDKDRGKDKDTDSALLNEEWHDLAPGHDPVKMKELWRQLLDEVAKDDGK